MSKKTKPVTVTTLKNYIKEHENCTLQEMQTHFEAHGDFTPITKDGHAHVENTSKHFWTTFQELIRNEKTVQLQPCMIKFAERLMDDYLPSGYTFMPLTLRCIETA